MPSNTLLLVARIFLAALFIVSGYGKFVGGPANFAGYLVQHGFPAPLFFAWATTALELLGGLAILVGLATRPVAIALMLFCFGTAAVAHLDLGDPTQLLKNIGIAGGFLLLAATGPGSISLDARLLGRGPARTSLA
ncbi:MAG: DoxX family protein [Pararhizobium sp.]